MAGARGLQFRGLKVEKAKILEAGERACRERHGGNCVFEDGDGTV